MTFCVPARSWRPSTFCVTRRNPGYRRLQAASTSWARFGRAFATSSPAPGVPLPHEERIAVEGLRRRELLGPVLTSRDLPGPRNVGIPLAAETPAPVTTVIRGLPARRAASARTASSRGSKPIESDDKVPRSPARGADSSGFLEDTWRTRFPSRSPTATASAPRSWTPRSTSSRQPAPGSRSKRSRSARRSTCAGNTAGIEPSAWESLRRTKVFLKAPITTPQGGGFKSLNVTTRKTLGLYANVRPCVSYHPFVATKHPGHGRRHRARERGRPLRRHRAPA